jgi:hypothetical protein
VQVLKFAMNSNLAMPRAIILLVLFFNSCTFIEPPQTDLKLPADQGLGSEDGRHTLRVHLLSNDSILYENKLYGLTEVTWSGLDSIINEHGRSYSDSSLIIVSVNEQAFTAVIADFMDIAQKHGVRVAMINQKKD